MNNSKLIQLIRESINEYIRDIDEAGDIAMYEMKIAKIGEAIELREKKIAMEGIDEAYHDMIDKGKMKELSGEVKALKKSLAKYEKQLEKLKSKGEKKEKVEDIEKKEIVDESFLNENRTAEELFQMFKDEGLLNDRREYDIEDLMSTYPGLSKEEAEKLENMLQDSNNLSELNNTNIYEMLYMQKLAGIITEAQYKQKVEMLNEANVITKEEAREYAESWEDDDILDGFDATFNNQEKVTKPEFMNFFKEYIDDMADMDYVRDAWKKLSSGEGLY